MVTITSFEVKDVRFPTSLSGTGSDAMNAAGDYSAAYCILHTTTSAATPSSARPLTGHGMTFTIGRGTELVCAAIGHIAPLLLDKPLAALTADMGATWRLLVSDSQLRWLGPEKGVMHLALAAVVNALWDLWAKAEGKPVWRLVAEMTPEEFVRCIDFRYIEDALTREEAVALLQEVQSGGQKEARIRVAEDRNRAVRAYTTSAGWLGYGEEKMKTLLQESVAKGWRHFKIKVGGDVEADRRRLALVREVIGYDDDGEGGVQLMVDANQVWSVAEAVGYMRQLAPFRPVFIEEPTSPDDVLGHAAIRAALAPLGIGVATGEMCQNRVVFKQLLQARALDVCQIDACRLGGVNEVLAVLLLASKFGVPVVPHSGGVGLPEYTQHLATVDYVCVSGRVGLVEHVESLHEHFKTPAEVQRGGRGGGEEEEEEEGESGDGEGGREGGSGSGSGGGGSGGGDMWCVTPRAPGYSVEMREESMREFAFPGAEGGFWQSEAGRKITGERRL